MILFVKKYHTFSGKVSYILKKVSYFWLMLKEEGAEGVDPRFRGAAPPAPLRRLDRVGDESDDTGI
jgi:hypothetical protein